jgi:hypothetical protein
MLSSELHPLCQLLRKDTKFEWSLECKRASEKTKKLLENCFTLSHYNPKNEIMITTDASVYGLGAILSQKIDGEVRPIMCASCRYTKFSGKELLSSRKGSDGYHFCCEKV